MYHASAANSSVLHVSNRNVQPENYGTWETSS